MNLNEILETFIDSNKKSTLSDRLIIIRQDGVCIYSNVEDSFESASISALVSGLWQAARSLNSLMEGEFNFSDYRLSFDTTSHGVYILPLLLKNEEYYMCSLFKDVSNPAKLKRQLRVLKDELEELVQGVEIKPSVDRSGYLFEDITDEEMDRIFQVNGV